MQTFLPYADFQDSAECLDKKRLWKQVVEARQLLNVLQGLTTGWANHPACRMWEGYTPLLLVYFDIMLRESLVRGVKVTAYTVNDDIGRQCHFDAPAWLGGEAFHAAHRSNLLRKDPVYYGQFGWVEPSNLPYIWPKGTL